ncbi:MAG: DMT family transporter, partial [Actinomycetota bacterium]|nr:DMT family transporter [Actinomycetota bacterium]
MLTERTTGPAGTRDGSRVGAAAAKDKRRTSLLFEGSLLATAVFLGTNPVAVKYAVGYVAPLPFAALRFVFAGLVLWAILRLFDPKGGLRREDFWAMAGLGLV